MKNQMHTNLLIRSSLVLTLAMASWMPIAATAAAIAADEPMKGGGHQMMLNEGTPKPSMDGKMMMQRCQAMKEQKKKMMADMKVQDAELTEQVAKMNRAPQDQKTDLIAAVVTQIVEQRTAMHAQMAKMQAEMMKPMQMGKESMAPCPMMKGMGGKQADAQTGHHAEQE